MPANRVDVVLTGHRMIAPDSERFLAVRMGARARSRPVDHTPLVTAPDDVVDIIRDAAADIVTPA